MNTVLTDAQVAALVDVYRDHDLELRGIEDHRVLPGEVEALAIEVQQFRLLQCRRCEQFAGGVLRGVGRCLHQEHPLTHVPDTWFCADFTSREDSE